MEFEDEGVIAKTLELSLLSLRSARAHFNPEFHGFNLIVETVSDSVPCGEQGFPIIACLLGLRREHLCFLSRIGRALGTYLGTPRMVESMIAKVAGLPSIRAIIADPSYQRRFSYLLW